MSYLACGHISRAVPLPLSLARTRRRLRGSGKAACLQTGTPFGNDRFRAQIEQALDVRVGYSTRGRPKKPPAEAASEERQLDMDFFKGFRPLFSTDEDCAQRHGVNAPAGEGPL